MMHPHSLPHPHDPNCQCNACRPMERPCDCPSCRAVRAPLRARVRMEDQRDFDERDSGLYDSEATRNLRADLAEANWRSGRGM